MPEVPPEPDDPEAPLVPDEPLIPLVPDVPLIPLVPDEPLVPEEPLVPLPLVPEEPAPPKVAITVPVCASEKYTSILFESIALTPVGMTTYPSLSNTVIDGYLSPIA